MTLSFAPTSEYQALAEQLAEVAANAIQPCFHAKLDVEDKGGRIFNPIMLAGEAAE